MNLKEKLSVANFVVTHRALAGAVVSLDKAGPTVTERDSPADPAPHVLSHWALSGAVSACVSAVLKLAIAVVTATETDLLAGLTRRTSILLAALLARHCQSHRTKHYRSFSKM